MNLDNVRREDWIVGGLALLLAICLLFLPWFHLSVSVGQFSASADYSATSTPDGWLGILALIAALAILADLAVERLSPQTQVPAIGGSRANTRFILALVAAAFVALKFLFHIHFSLFGWGFYVTVVVTAALVYFAAEARNTEPATTGGAARPAAPSGPSAPTGTGGGTAAGTPGATPPAEGSGRSVPPPGS